MKARKKRYYIVAGAVFTGCIVAAGGLGFWLGNSGKPLPEKTSVILSEANKEEQEKTRLIAVVNQDTGIASGGNTVNYAAKLLSNLGENFSVVGLEAARKGIEDGTYGAYVAIPSSFSESVVSLNQTPKKAQIEFAVNNNLSAEVMDDVVLETISFVNGINHNLSYMYINTILKEFHNTQDAAAEVMDNDKKDTKIILDIRPEDLIELVPIAETARVENQTELLNVQEYMEKNRELVETVDGQYTQYITVSKSDFEALNEQGNGLLEQWATMEGVIDGIQLTKDEDGGIVYEDGMQEAKSLLDIHNNNLLLTGKNISQISSETVKSLDNALDDKETQIKDYNTKLQSSLNTLANVIKDSYLFPAIELQEDGLYLFNEQILIPYEEYVDDGTLSEWERKWHSRLGIMAEYMENREAYIAETQAYIALLESLLPEETVFTPPDTMIYTPDSAELQAAGCDSLSDMLDKLNNGDWKREIAKEVIEKPVNLERLKSNILGIIDTHMIEKQVFDTSVDSQVEKVPMYQDILLKDLEDGSQEETSVKKLLQETMAGLQANIGDNLITSLDTESVFGIVDEQIIQPVVERTEKVTGGIKQQYDSEKQQYLTYNQLFGEYDPLKYIDQKEIADTVGKMQENGTTLQDKISDHDNAQSEFVDEVYKTTGENTDLLAKNIEEAKEKSEKAVSDGLSEAQAVKEENSSVNQALLYDFTQKLSYTRLGSLEYLQVYEFMANPLELVKNEAEGKRVIKDAINATTDIVKKPDRIDSGVRDLKVVLLIMGGIILTILSAYLAKWISSKGKRTTMEEFV